jgi:7,8-dihydropterin-6-yl-methyl-4-(beta-D-ribofuranosyl)aminobenzene 5'-phosphate synthase
MLQSLLKVFALVMIWLSCFALQGLSDGRGAMAEPKGFFLIIYDNNTLRQDLTASWGFSCLIDLPHAHILFDTGGDASILLRNMRRMDIDPGRIDTVVLSHGHGDHTGGLFGLLQVHNDLTVYIPESFPRRFKEEVIFMGAQIKEVGGPMMIHPGVYTSGELGQGIKEQSLFLKTTKGLVILTGCAHPGIVEIAEEARRLFEDKVHLVIGGLHLSGHSRSQIKAIAERLDATGMEKIAPCHCSGDMARALLRNLYADNYMPCGVGLLLEIPSLQR